MNNEWRKWSHIVAREAEKKSLDEIFREVMESERERIEDERESVIWFGSYQDANRFYAIGG